MPQTPSHLNRLIEPVVEAMGCELVGVEFHGGVLRVYIDRSEGVTLDDCEAVSRHLSGLLDVEDPIPGQYTLEVSSPGLDRPLFGARDFERFAGSRVKLRTRAPVDGRRNFKGMLLGVRGQRVVIEQDGDEVSLPLELVEQARLVPEY